jgi:hypothetical protein
MSVAAIAEYFVPKPVVNPKSYAALRRSVVLADCVPVITVNTSEVHVKTPDRGIVDGLDILAPQPLELLKFQADNLSASVEAEPNMITSDGAFPAPRGPPKKCMK